mmetsp:Transcript_125896/g.268594  ORF Transcript_125896/g.268594 Transcript_125896/m.268594 type:complete len:264 (+) Transcript_125896:220-1011(+)
MRAKRVPCRYAHVGPRGVTTEEEAIARSRPARQLGYDLECAASSRHEGDHRAANRHPVRLADKLRAVDFAVDFLVNLEKDARMRPAAGPRLRYPRICLLHNGYHFAWPRRQLHSEFRLVVLCDDPAVRVNNLEEKRLLVLRQRHRRHGRPRWCHDGCSLPLPRSLRHPLRGHRWGPWRCRHRRPSDSQRHRRQRGRPRRRLLGGRRGPGALQQRIWKARGRHFGDAHVWAVHQAALEDNVEVMVEVEYVQPEETILALFRVKS